MSKIGIMGGTFNPIHYGHLLLAESAYEQFSLDTVLIMPNKYPQYRMISSEISEAHRTAMIELAIASNPHFKLSYEELNRDGATYTVDTLKALTTRHPDNCYYFIMGADSLFHFESWRDTKAICRLCEIVAAPRVGQVSADLESQIDYLCAKFDAHIHLLNSPNLDISSHGIRKKIRNHQTFKYLLPEPVEEYIKEHRLYTEQ